MILQQSEPMWPPGWEKFPYDYKSILHFNGNRYAKEGLLVIEPLQPGVEVGNSNVLTMVMNNHSLVELFELALIHT